MSLGLKIFLIVLVILVAILVGLMILGNRLRKKQEASQAQLDAMKQTVSMLIIDKKRMKMKDAQLPKIVMDQTPKYLRGAKMPFVKAKIGPKIMTLIADEKIFNQIPVKAEVKAEISGIYITAIKSVRGGRPVEEAPKKKKFFDRFKKNDSKTTAASKNDSKKSSGKK